MYIYVYTILYIYICILIYIYVYIDIQNYAYVNHPLEPCKETEAEKTQRKAKETRQGRGLRT